MQSDRLHILITDGAGAKVAAWDSRVRGLSLRKDKHGPASATWSVMSLPHEAFRYYGELPGKKATVSACGRPVWVGRIEDVKLTDAGIDVTAFGYQNALRDLPFTQFWSSTRTDEWEVVQPTHVAGRSPDRYRLETQAGLYLSLQRGDTYGAATDVGSLMYRIPNGTARLVYTMAFDWAVTLPTNWQLVVETRTAAFGSAAPTTIVTGNGALQSGSSALTLTANEVVIVSIFNNTGANYTAAGETGSQVARLQSVRIKGTTSASLYADEIVREIVAQMSGANPTQLSGATAMIQSPGLDLRDENYLDLLPSDILNYLTELGDTATPPRVWEWGVTNDQALYFRPRGSGRSWYVDAAELSVEQSLSNLINAAFATYQEASGRTLRTSVSTDPISIQRAGFQRRTALSTSTTASGQATTHRDAALNDGKDPRPRTAIEVRVLRSDSGSRAYPWEADSGDTVTIRNLPPTISASVDRIRSFVISEVEYDADTGIAKLTPEDPVPSLDVITARYAAGMGFVVSPFTAGKRTNRR